MPLVSIIIPSRNEMFLRKTTEDLLAKARGEVEILIVLDGYDINDKVDDPRVHYIVKEKAWGMRSAINTCAAQAKGKYLLKTDAHCMFDEGYDVKLAADCEKDWVCVPTRWRLEPEKWQLDDRGRSPINYLYIECPTAKDAKGDLGGREWRELNYDENLQKQEIVDLMTFQGSCWFMHREYYYFLDLMDEYHYGTFRKEPQEISFKCWLSGGRVIRNKKTWYAHLHKGKKYSRGYSFNPNDWEKGDNYNKKWLTGEAWHKQIYDFKWLIDKFNPPGWEGYDWGDPPPPQTVLNRHKLHQNISVGNNVFSCENEKRKDSKFWNEGKWDTFIKPLIPKEHGDTFVEIGSNAGLYLNMASEYGFRDVYGVEQSKNTLDAAREYRRLLGKNYKLLQGKLGEGFDIYNLPVADVTLLSNVHYYFNISEWLKYLDILRSRTRYCIVVSRELRLKEDHWIPSGDRDKVRGYFKDWKEVGCVDNVSMEGDPHPRELYSFCFKTDLESVLIDDIFIRKDTDEIDVATMTLIKEICEKNHVEAGRTEYFKAWRKRKIDQWSERKTLEFVQKKVDALMDVKRNGLKDPLIVQGSGKLKGKLSDGGHRLALLKELGYQRVIVRYV